MASRKKKRGQEEQPAVLPNPLKTMMPNYQVYHMTLLEKAVAAAVAFAAGGVCSQIFYGGLFKQDGEATPLTYISAVILVAAVGFAAVKLFMPIRQNQLRKKRQEKLRLQFRDMLESLTASLAAGDTVFQAFESTRKDITLQYGENSDLALELEQFVQAPNVGVPLETMLQDFAERSGNEDIISFGSVFSVCYTSGGNMRDVMRRTHDIITDKMEVADEIRTKLSSNRLELNIVTLAPIGIVMLFRAMAPSFAEKFASVGGVAAMTVAIVLFVAAYRMGQKIVQIGEV